MNSTAKFDVEWSEFKSKSFMCPDKAVGTVRPAFWRHLTKAAIVAKDRGPSPSPWRSPLPS